jgi:hypothetical protein
VDDRAGARVRETRILGVLWVAGVLASTGGTVAACNAVCTDAGPARLAAGIALGVLGLASALTGMLRR